MSAFQPKPKKAGARTPPKAWSYSRWSKYEECPLAFHLGLESKVREPPNAAMERGSAIHAEGDQYLKGALDEVPPSFKLFEQALKALRKHKAIGEEEWAFDENWQPCGWFDQQCWCRIKTDAHAPLPKSTMRVIDYKTGRIWGTNHEPQLELYGLGAFKMYEGIAIVKAELWYLDQGTPIPRTYLAKNEKQIQDRWEKRVAAMLNDTIFDPKPGPQCKRCPYGKSKGGVCQHG